MPLWVLAGSVIAVLALVLVNIALTGWRRRPLPDLATATAALRGDLHRFEPADGLVSGDGRAALVAARDGGFGLVLAMGDHLATRACPWFARGAVTQNDARLRLDLSDFTLPPVTLACQSEAEARFWAQRLTHGDASPA